MHTHYRGPKFPYPLSTWHSTPLHFTNLQKFIPSIDFAISSMLNSSTEPAPIEMRSIRDKNTSRETQDAIVVTCSKNLFQRNTRWQHSGCFKCRKAKPFQFTMIAVLPTIIHGFDIYENCDAGIVSKQHHKQIKQQNIHTRSTDVAQSGRINKNEFKTSPSNIHRYFTVWIQNLCCCWASTQFFSFQVCIKR